MPTNTLTAKANVGAGTDGLAGINTAQGFAGAVMLVSGAGTDISGANPLPVSVGNFPATQAVTQSGAWSVSISGSAAVTGPLTDAQLRAVAVPVSFTWAGLTDAQLRATPVPVNANKQALTAASPTTATIGIASGAAVALNASRKGLYLKNTSTSGQRISLAFGGGTAVLDSGITLETGDAYVMEEFDLTTGAVNAISSAASGRLSVQEWT